MCIRDRNRIGLIKKFYEDYNVIVDTHTADGLKAALDHYDSSIPMLVLETALPIKFEKSIFEAIGKYPDRPQQLQNIESLTQHNEVFDNDVDEVKNFITKNT